MEFRTIVDIPRASWQIRPLERVLLIGSCFAGNMGERFLENKFRAVVNPFGTMYNPASVLHSVQRLAEKDGLPFSRDDAGVAIFTFGTNHVYILKQTNEIVDNCEKRPQKLFREEQLDVEACVQYMDAAIRTVQDKFPKVNIILTVSPIRYRKYGYHGSRLSKATLHLAVERVLGMYADKGKDGDAGCVEYFPAYEIIEDELRDYRFYAPDMLHPSQQAVEYVWQRFGETYFSDETVAFINRWNKVLADMNHRPIHPESETYKLFLDNLERRKAALRQAYPELEI